MTPPDASLTHCRSPPRQGGSGQHYCGEHLLGLDGIVRQHELRHHIRLVEFELGQGHSRDDESS